MVIGYVINNPPPGVGNGLGLNGSAVSSTWRIKVYSCCNSGTTGVPSGTFVTASGPSGTDCGYLNLSAEQQWGNIGGIDRLGIAVSIVPTNGDIVSQNGNVNRSISVSIPIEFTI